MRRPAFELLDFDAESEFAALGVDPVVAALALALIARRPLADVVGGSSAIAPSAAAPDSRTRPPEAWARPPRPMNRKG